MTEGIFEMSLLRRILDRLNDATNAPTPAPQPVARPALQPPTQEDDSDMLTPDETGIIQLDEVYSTIDYVDAQGNGSRRRISMRSISGGSHGPILKAICHERHALRAFRCDRIECFIDDDGVVTESDDFFREILRIDLDAFASLSLDEPQEGAPVLQMKEKLRTPISVLVGLAKCDGLHDAEVAAILNYIEDEVFAPDRYDQFDGITPQDIDKLEPIIRRMRPSRSSLQDRLDRLQEMTEPQLDRFHRAVRKVVHADGKVSPQEIEAYSIIEDWKVCREDFWCQ